MSYEVGVIGLIVAWAAPVWAADVGLGANLLAMGGVGVAALSDNAAITLNPGLLALRRRYDFQGMFQYGPEGGLQWGASAMDGRTSNNLAAGIAYIGDRTSPELDENELPGWIEPGVEVTNVRRMHDFAGAFAVPFLERKLSIGVGVNVGLFNHDRGGEGWNVDLDAGVGFHPVEALTVGVSTRNVLAVSEQDLPPAVRAGVRIEGEQVLAFEVNAEQRFLPEEQRPEFPLWMGVGFEKPIGRARLRAGFQHDPYSAVEAGSYATAGIGVTDQGGVVEYGLMIPLDPPTLGGTVHGFQISFGAPPEIEEPD